MNNFPIVCVGGSAGGLAACSGPPGVEGTDAACKRDDKGVKSTA